MPSIELSDANTRTHGGGSERDYKLKPRQENFIENNKLGSPAMEVTFGLCAED